MSLALAQGRILALVRTNRQTGAKVLVRAPGVPVWAGSRQSGGSLVTNWGP